MDFVPFQPPASLHDPLNAGLSSEKGVTAKELVDGINRYFAHLFGVKNGDAPAAPDHVDLEARVAELEEALTAAQRAKDIMAAEIDAVTLRLAALERYFTAGDQPTPSTDKPKDAGGSAIDAINQALGAS